MPPVPPLPASALTSPVKAGQLSFGSTAELECLPGFFGHCRAIEAIEFAVAMPDAGYNLFVLGEPGTGRLSLMRQMLEQAAVQQAAPEDWLYLQQFDEVLEPIPLALPAGLGQSLVTDIEMLVDGLLVSVWSAFENPAYQRRKANLERQFKERYDASLDRVAERAEKAGVVMYRGGETVTFSPLRDGRPVEELHFAELSEDERDRFHREVKKLEDYLGESLLELPQWKRETDDRLRLLARELVEQAVAPLLARVREKYAGSQGVGDYLGRMQADFSRAVIPAILEQRVYDPAAEEERRERFRHRYTPRLLVSRSPQQGAPVRWEADPNLRTLFGRIEYVVGSGSPSADHHLIYPGALHQANGGYLILEACKVMAEPPVWNALKRSLQSGSVRFEAPVPDPGSATVAALCPGPIPLSVKIALLGPPELFYAMRELDVEFPELFRVLAEFDRYFVRTDAALKDFACLVKTLTERKHLPPLTAAAVSDLLVESARLAEHQDRLSAQVGRIIEVAAEADFFRRRAGDEFIDTQHIKQALTARSRRIGRIREELLAQILDGVILVATDGTAVGSVNALTLLEIGDSRVGSPARITATAHAGSRGVVDIEREVELGQAIHSKGVMILAGYLGQHFARSFPLAMSANIALEQSYGFMDGDSAALAEACALLSALTSVPIDQSYAVTGSLNQYGEVQAVGGVNEKVEAFFEVCAARGLTGRQGVVIPSANQRNLVLADEVVQAVQEGRFGIYPVLTLDEALEILTRRPAEALRTLAHAELERFASLALPGSSP